ncbi:MAG: hypothetical protein ACTHNU_05265 [Gaiellales bacterium]
MDRVCRRCGEFRTTGWTPARCPICGGVEFTDAPPHLADVHVHQIEAPADAHRRVPSAAWPVVGVVVWVMVLAGGLWWA